MDDIINNYLDFITSADLDDACHAMSLSVGFLDSVLNSSHVNSENILFLLSCPVLPCRLPRCVRAI